MEVDDIVGKVDFDCFEELVFVVNYVLIECVDEVGFDYEDGKIECFYYDGIVKVGDVVGMFDENWFFYGG